MLSVVRPMRMFTIPLFRRFWWLQSLVLIWLLLTGCGSYTPEVHTPALWKATSAQGSTMYLFGSVHVGHATYYPLHPTIQKAYKDSNKLFVEVDILNIDAKKYATLSEDARNEVKDGKKKVSPDIELKIKRALARRGVNANEIYNRYKFWYLMELLTQQTLPTGLHPDYGVDAHFLKQAQEDKMPIVELETIKSQLQMLVDIGNNHPNTYYNYLTDYDYRSFSIVRLLTLWKKGNPDALAESLFAPLTKNEEFEPIYKALFFDRNKAMAEKLIKVHKAGETPFVVVGAGHFVGKQSILTHLQKSGYKVEQVELVAMARNET